MNLGNVNAIYKSIELVIVIKRLKTTVKATIGVKISTPAPIKKNNIDISKNLPFNFTSG